MVLGLCVMIYHFQDLSWPLSLLIPGTTLWDGYCYACLAHEAQEGLVAFQSLQSHQVTELPFALRWSDPQIPLLFQLYPQLPAKASS